MPEETSRKTPQEIIQKAFELATAEAQAARRAADAAVNGATIEERRKEAATAKESAGQAGKQSRPAAGQKNNLNNIRPRPADHSQLLDAIKKAADAARDARNDAERARNAIWPLEKQLKGRLLTLLKGLYTRLSNEKMDHLRFAEFLLEYDVRTQIDDKGNQLFRLGWDKSTGKIHFAPDANQKPPDFKPGEALYELKRNADGTPMMYDTNDTYNVPKTDPITGKKTTEKVKIFTYIVYNVHKGVKFKYSLDADKPYNGKILRHNITNSEIAMGVRAFDFSQFGTYKVRNEKEMKDSMHICASYVKIALTASGIFKTYTSTGAAKDLNNDLKNAGLVNILEPGVVPDKYKPISPYHTPPGAVIVIDYPEYGHVEIKRYDDKNPFISDFLQSGSVLGYEIKDSLQRWETIPVKDANKKPVLDADGKPMTKRILAKEVIGIFVTPATLSAMKELAD